MNTAGIIHHSENIPNMMYTDSALMRAWTLSAMSDRYFDFAIESLCKKKSPMMWPAINLSIVIIYFVLQYTFLSGLQTIL